MDRTRFLPLLAAVLILSVSESASACSIPVFRYALEHWVPDPYVATVFHRGDLDAGQQELLARLRPAGPTGQPAVNLTIRTVDLDGDMDDQTRALWEAQRTESLPWLAVQQKARGPVPAVDVWSGELSAENAGRIVESPVRRWLAERLLAGDSVLWVFLESGDKPQDDAAYAVLSTELERLQGVLELPPIDPADAAQLSVAPEGLKLAFQSRRVSRDDPAERLFVEMLLSVEPDLRQEPYVKMPMAFPVFGRGCALYALAGAGINAATIEEASRFLIGGCQCTVKEQNPGTDLLLAVDWDLHVAPSSLPAATPPPGGLSGLADDEGAPPAAGSAPTLVAVPPGALMPSLSREGGQDRGDDSAAPPMAAPLAAATASPAGGFGRLAVIALALLLAGGVLWSARLKGRS